MEDVRYLMERRLEDPWLPWCWTRTRCSAEQSTDLATGVVLQNNVTTGETLHPLDFLNIKDVLWSYSIKTIGYLFFTGS